MSSDTLDVLIVGAGLSGIGAAAEFRRRFPSKKIVILESRDRLGGTWDLFRYPGIRSDSDMYTFGFKAKPWRTSKSIVDGPAILDYLREMANESGVASIIQYGKRVESVDWSSARCEWTVTVRDRAGATSSLCTRFLHLCTGYYSYTEGYRPHFEGEADFCGQIIHPQFWPESLDYTGRRIVVIGSGATAVTLVPALAEKALHVTQLQRSPSYVVNQPSVDPWARVLSKILPAAVLYPAVRWKHILLTSFFYQLARKYPRWFGQRLVELAAEDLPKGYDVARHFKPGYNPWDQRVCAAPDGDLFQAIAKGRVSVVTDTINRFVPEGVKLNSGETLAADIIVTATGLKVLPLGAIHLSLDDKAVNLDDSMVYRGAMLSGIPNLVLTFGYTNASWTLRADLIAAYVCRLIGYFDRHGYQYAVPVRDSSVGEMPFIDFSSGYVLRALEGLPKQGDRFPWRVYQTYLRDLGVTRYRRISDPVLRFGRAGS
ncbi:MAG: NAD(P)/FAD-dependent oxidoreductase [Gammaproteobacteria bacterium]|nr:NAD(P)/FAD-dependent oxidoreductase [Gammaproteobacteria bacterium]